ncbi:ABC transporter ATP-binding protein [Staphylococcus simulans]|nr:ABC transporter ATP-binding protein [Staphylococcus simulans]
MKEKRKKMFLYAIFCVSVLFSVSSLIFPLLAKNIVNDFEKGNIRFLSIVGVVLFLVLKSIVEAIYEYMIAKFGNYIIKDLREQVYSKIIHYKTSFFDKHHSGELSSRILNDTEVIKELIATQIPQLVSGSVLIVGSFILTLFLDWKLTIAIIVIIPTIFILIAPLLKNMDSIGTEQQNEKANFMATTQETFKNVKMVKAFTAEYQEKSNIKVSINKLYKITLKESKIMAIIGPTINFLLIFGLLLIIGYGAFRVSNGTLKLSILIAFIMYVFQLINPMANISGFIGEYRKANGAFASLNNILNKDNEEETGKLKYCFKYNLKFNNVSLNLSRNNILDSVNFVLKKGENLCIVGSSGSGKTTITNLIEKFYNPSYGNITIDDVPISQINNFELRNNIGIVSQDSPIISGSILDNLLYGLNREIISNNDISNAMKKANIDSMILSKKNGLNTYVGEQGSQLSGGEKQRINIARLFLKDPDIILLDEPTSSLDVQSKELVIKSIEELTKHKTVIKITHSISEISDYEDVLFIEKGKILSQGKKNNLTHNNEKFKKFIQLK